MLVSSFSIIFQTAKDHVQRLKSPQNQSGRRKSGSAMKRGKASKKYKQIFMMLKRRFDNIPTWKF